MNHHLVLILNKDLEVELVLAKIDKVMILYVLILFNKVINNKNSIYLLKIKQKIRIMQRIIPILIMINMILQTKKTINKLKCYNFYNNSKIISIRLYYKTYKPKIIVVILKVTFKLTYKLP